MRTANGQRAKEVSEKAIIEYNLNFAEGTKNKLIGDKKLSIFNFVKCIELQPTKAAPYYQLSDIYLSIDDKNKALFFAQKCNVYEKNNIWYILQLAVLYQSIGNIDSSIILYHKLVKLSPRKEEFNLNLAYLYFKAGKPKKSIQVLLEYRKRSFLSENLALTLYQIYSYQKDTKNALAILREAKNRFPGETRFYGLLAESFVSVNNYDSAFYYYTELLKIDPGNEKGSLSLIEYYKLRKDSSSVLQLSSVFFSDAAFSFAEKINLLTFFINDKAYLFKYRSQIDTFLNSLIKAYPEANRLYILQIDFYLQLKDYSKAKTCLLEVTSKYNANYPVWEQLLYTLNVLQEYTEVIKYSELAMARFPDKPLPAYFNGLAYFNLKEYGKAVPPLLQSFEVSKSDTKIHFQVCVLLAETFQLTKEYPKSSYYFERALQFEPTNLLILNNYSYYLSLRGENLENAVKYSKFCVDKEPNSSTYLDTHAWALYKSGNFSEAKLVIEKAIRISQMNNTEILEHYCEILYYFGSKDEALKVFRILESRKSNNESLKKLFDGQ